jgi:hypothetical protein
MSHIFVEELYWGVNYFARNLKVHGFLGDEQILIKSLSEIDLIEYVCEYIYIYIYIYMFVVFFVSFFSVL